MGRHANRRLLDADGTELVRWGKDAVVISAEGMAHLFGVSICKTCGGHRPDQLWHQQENALVDESCPECGDDPPYLSPETGKPFGSTEYAAMLERKAQGATFRRSKDKKGITTIEEVTSP